MPDVNVSVANGSNRDLENRLSQVLVSNRDNTKLAASLGRLFPDKVKDHEYYGKIVSFLTTEATPGLLEEVFGPKTREIFIQFQLEHNIIVTPAYNKGAVWERLNIDKLTVKEIIRHVYVALKDEPEMARKLNIPDIKRLSIEDYLHQVSVAVDIVLNYFFIDNLAKVNVIRGIQQKDCKTTINAMQVAFDQRLIWNFLNKMAQFEG